MRVVVIFRTRSITKIQKGAPHVKTCIIWWNTGISLARTNPWTIPGRRRGRRTWQRSRKVFESGQFLGIHHPEIEALEKELAEYF